MARIDNTINVNSSYSITASEVDLEGLKLSIWVYTGIQGDSALDSVALLANANRVLTPTYSLQATATLHDNAKVVEFEVSSLIKDFIESELDGTYNTTNTVWVDIQTTKVVAGLDFIQASQHFLAVDGYEYTRNDGVADIDKVIRLSNRHVLKLSASDIVVPVLKQQMVDYTFSKDGVTTSTGVVADFPDSLLSNEQIVYLSNDSLEVDKLVITSDLGEETITIENVDECRYDETKLTFVNKFGAFQDVWFFKNSKRAVEVKSSKWNRRNKVVGGGAYRPTALKNTTDVNEKISLNSGFYPENNNVVFEELMQSDSVWLWEGSDTHPVIVKDSSFDFKDSNTDKLINYTIKIEYAFNKMKTL